jgi:hypothetical protein
MILSVDAEKMWQNPTSFCLKKEEEESLNKQE